MPTNAFASGAQTKNFWPRTGSTFDVGDSRHQEIPLTMHSELTTIVNRGRWGRSPDRRYFMNDWNMPADAGLQWKGAHIHNIHRWDGVELHTAFHRLLTATLESTDILCKPVAGQRQLAHVSVWALKRAEGQWEILSVHFFVSTPRKKVKR